MSRFLLSVEVEELGYNVADMTAYSTDEYLLRMPSSNATPACSEILKQFSDALVECFRIYPLSYEALQRFIKAPNNLTCPRLPGLIVMNHSTSEVITIWHYRNLITMFNVLVMD